MIVDGLLMLITGIVQFAFDLLPDWSVRDQLMNAIKQDGRFYTPLSGYVETATNSNPINMMFKMMWQMNKYLPVDHFFAALSLVVTFWGAILAYRLGKWLIGVIRGAGTQ